MRLKFGCGEPGGLKLEIAGVMRGLVGVGVIGGVEGVGVKVLGVEEAGNGLNTGVGGFV